MVHKAHDALFCSSPRSVWNCGKSVMRIVEANAGQTEDGRADLFTDARIMRKTRNRRPISETGGLGKMLFCVMGRSSCPRGRYCYSIVT